MDRQTFEQKIKQEIDSRLFIEDTDYRDIDRINLLVEGKLRPITLCAFPKNGVKEEFDPGYTSTETPVPQPFPSREQLEAKIRAKITNLDLTLYE